MSRFFQHHVNTGASAPHPPFQRKGPPRKAQLILGWAAVAFATLISSAWAVWGSIENFYEGWYYPSLWQNLGLMVVQYLSPLLISLGLSLIAIRWPRVGGGLCLLAGVAFLGWLLLSHLATFSSFLSWMLLISPLLLAGLLFWFGRPWPRRFAVAVAVGIPLLVVLMLATPAATRVAGRVNDGNFGMRLVKGNGITLLWAPQGPGWPKEGRGPTWDEATATCGLLSSDGTKLASTPQNIWRLPRIEEVVRSQVRHGQNAGGTWDARSGQASYTVQPDKETPLWNPDSLVIYWWTATQVDARYAYRINYQGSVESLPKEFRANYLQFRCVKEPEKSQSKSHQQSWGLEVSPSPRQNEQALERSKHDDNYQWMV